MTLRDMHGQALSTRRAGSAAAYDQALALFNRLQPASMTVVERSSPRTRTSSPAT